MEDHSRCVYVAGEWLGRGNTLGFGRGNSRGVLKEAANECTAYCCNNDDDDAHKKGSL